MAGAAPRTLILRGMSAEVAADGPGEAAAETEGVSTDADARDNASSGITAGSAAAPRQSLMHWHGRPWVALQRSGPTGVRNWMLCPALTAIQETHPRAVCLAAILQLHRLLMRMHTSAAMQLQSAALLAFRKAAQLPLAWCASACPTMRHCLTRIRAACSRATWSECQLRACLHAT